MNECMYVCMFSWYSYIIRAYWILYAGDEAVIGFRADREGERLVFAEVEVIIVSREVSRAV